MQEEIIKKREKIEIYSDMLEAAKGGATKKVISNKAQMRSDRVNEYLGELEKSKLVEQSGKIYRTTEKGFDFLSKYNELAEILELEDKVVIE
jgi:predicted transcriptional regulator